MSEGKGALERPRRRWKENIKTGLTEIEWYAMDWINLALVRMMLNLGFP
jgi:hypothetical protein